MGPMKTMSAGGAAGTAGTAEGAAAEALAVGAALAGAGTPAAAVAGRPADDAAVVRAAGAFAGFLSGARVRTYAVAPAPPSTSAATNQGSAARAVLRRCG